MSMFDGYYMIHKLEDGIYLEVSPAGEGGKEIDIMDIELELNAKGITEYDAHAIIDVLKNLTEKTTVRIAESDVGDYLSYVLYVSEDQQKLIISFKDNVPIDKDKILQEIKQLGIVVPVDECVIEEVLSDKKLNKDYVIATGSEAVQPKQPTIEYYFKTDKDLRPEVDEKGNVNYHKLHLFASVKKDQLLATLIPGTPGASGIDVYGNEIKPLPLKPLRLRRGKNVRISEDKTQLYSEVDGLVKLDGDKVIVNNTLDIAENVGSSTGDIDFDGSVIINGNVRTGFKVRAKGDIEVLGVVEGAHVEAGGNIVLHRGIQGMNKCKIIAGGNLNATYIENADVVASGMIHSEAILHSCVASKGEIVVEGKKGMISGGSVRSGISIKTNILGSHMGTTTTIDVGIDPLVLEEYNNIKKELPKLQEEAEKLEQVIVLLNKKKEIDGELDEQKKNMFVSATRNKIFLSNKVNVSLKRLEELKEEVEKRNDGFIIVHGNIYPGVRISIGTAKYFVREEFSSVKMIKNGADVKILTL